MTFVVHIAGSPAQAITVFPDARGDIAQSQAIAGKKKPIDKSCLMICEKWGENDCEKWVMKCEGDAGHPKGLTLQR